MSDQPETENTTEGSQTPPAPPPAAPSVDLFAQCEKCDEPAYPLVKTETPRVKGLCAAHLPPRAVEEWAREAGMLPELFAGGQMQVNAHPHAQLARVSLRRSNEVARRHNPKYRLFAGAKAMFRWPEGLLLTKADFDKAVEAADTGVEIR